MVFSIGEVVPKQEFTYQQETNSTLNHTPVVVSKAHDDMDNEVANNDNKMTADDSKTTTDSGSSSSDNTTLIAAEDNTEIVQVQPMQSPIVSNSDTQPQPIITNNKEDDTVRSVSEQSTLSQSCEEITSENITYSITQPKVIGMVLCIVLITYAMYNRTCSQYITR